MIERALILSTGSVLEIDPELVSAAPAGAAPVGAACGSLLAIEKEHIQRVLERTGGAIEGAAGALREILDMHPNTLRSRMKKLGIRRTGDDAAATRLS